MVFISLKQICYYSGFSMSILRFQFFHCLVNILKVKTLIFVTIIIIIHRTKLCHKLQECNDLIMFSAYRDNLYDMALYS